MAPPVAITNFFQDFCTIPSSAAAPGVLLPIPLLLLHAAAALAEDDGGAAGLEHGDVTAWGRGRWPRRRRRRTGRSTPRLSRL